MREYKNSSYGGVDTHPLLPWSVGRVVSRYDETRRNDAPLTFSAVATLKVFLVNRISLKSGPCECIFVQFRASYIR